MKNKGPIIESIGSLTDRPDLACNHSLGKNELKPDPALMQERIEVLEDALEQMLSRFGDNYALSAVQTACKALRHPIKEQTDEYAKRCKVWSCYCLARRGVVKEGEQSKP